MISETYERFHIYFCFEYVFFVASQFCHCSSFSIDDFRITDVRHFVMVDANAVDANEISLIFNSSCCEQSVPDICLRLWPVGDEYCQVVFELAVLIAVAEPYWETKVVADFEEDADTLPLYHHTFSTCGEAMVLASEIGRASCRERVCLSV